MAKVVARHPLHHQPRDTEFWLSRSPSQRLDAVEIFRQAWLESHSDAGQGLQRVSFMSAAKRRLVSCQSRTEWFELTSFENLT
ncbi:MAG: hypothetical protein NDI67_12470 [Sulfuritalea sp.]|nr:hypothetical protein [Sulfuritalea sp.]